VSAETLVERLVATRFDYRRAVLFVVLVGGKCLGFLGLGELVVDVGVGLLRGGVDGDGGPRFRWR
jgi:hypothetical protein